MFKLNDDAQTLLQAFEAVTNGTLTLAQTVEEVTKIKNSSQYSALAPTPMSLPPPVNPSTSNSTSLSKESLNKNNDSSKNLLTDSGDIDLLGAIDFNSSPEVVQPAHTSPSSLPSPKLKPATGNSGNSFRIPPPTAGKKIPSIPPTSTPSTNVGFDPFGTGNNAIDDLLKPANNTTPNPKGGDLDAFFLTPMAINPTSSIPDNNTNTNGGNKQKVDINSLLFGPNTGGMTTYPAGGMGGMQTVSGGMNVGGMQTMNGGMRFMQPMQGSMQNMTGGIGPSNPNPYVQASFPQQTPPPIPTSLLGAVNGNTPIMMNSSMQPTSLAYPPPITTNIPPQTSFQGFSTSLQQQQQQTQQQQTQQQQTQQQQPKAEANPFDLF